MQEDGMNNINPQMSALSALQEAFGLYQSNGDFFVVDLKQVSDIQSGAVGNIEFYKKQPAELLLKRFLENLSVPSKPKEVIADFWINPSTTVFTGIAFSPTPQSTSILNYWVGPTAIPVQGDCSVINEFLLNVICAGSRDSYSYLMSYLAHMYQRPEEKPGVMIALLGGQGTGKGTFFRLLQAIWGQTTLQVSDVNEIVGQFNAALERNLIILMDEALFSGDRKAQDRLKSIITEPKCRIEQKYQPARTIDSYHRLFAASNHKHFAQVDDDDRRFVFLRVSESMRGNHEYFEKISKAITDQVIINAFVYELDNLSIDTFNIRQKPSTQEYLNQKVLSLNGFSRYWFEVLSTGNLKVRDNISNDWNEPIFIATTELVENYTNFDKKAEWYRSIQQNQITDELKRLCPLVECDRQQNGSRGQKRGWILPSLEMARKQFENYIGGKIQWPDEFEQPVGFSKETLDEYWAHSNSRQTAKEFLENFLN